MAERNTFLGFLDQEGKRVKQVSRVWFTPQQKAELWECWKGGQCTVAIA
jgi:hypothetical protein